MNKSRLTSLPDKKLLKMALGIREERSHSPRHLEALKEHLKTFEEELLRRSNKQADKFQKEAIACSYEKFLKDNPNRYPKRIQLTPY